VLGRDNDLGYGIMRVDEDQRWVPMFLGQPLWNFINAWCAHRSQPTPPHR
jgi:NADPH-dependent stearoyl-CoA 9-desaturase